ncbi:cytochrome P450, partial [Paraburkholderia sediminicola]|uniref:cytochrome P450 n=1 Tax=Paraburkholderia sediminicola TaxID=458836 RepID=UPI0038B90F01
MTEDLKRYTVDVTSALAFGDDPGTLEQDGNVIQEHLALIFPMLMNRINAPFPYWRYVKLPRDHRLDHALAEVHRYVRLTMNRARERIRDRPHDEPCNLLEAMLQFRDTPGSGITDDQVAANVLTMLLAGEDTTAHSIAWALLYLSSDDALQSRVSNRSRAVLGAAGVCPTYETLKTLDLCEAVCTEASRFRPVIPVHAFEPLQDVEHHGIHLPAGSRMFFLTRPSMLDASNFEHP